MKILRILNVICKRSWEFIKYKTLEFGSYMNALSDRHRNQPCCSILTAELVFQGSPLCKGKEKHCTAGMASKEENKAKIASDFPEQGEYTGAASV